MSAAPRVDDPAESLAKLPPLAVLIVDDEKNIRATLRVCLEALGAKVVEAASVDAAHTASRHQQFELAFVDLRLGEANGLSLIPSLLAKSPQLDLVIITAYGTVESAVEAIQLGARNVLQKPFSPTQIREIVERVERRRALDRELRDLRSQRESLGPEIDLESRSPRVRQLLAMLARAATRDVSVLLRGENGTGKSVLARYLHALSARSSKPFVVVNCPTLSQELLASELFGHARGSFTGAIRDQAGRVEAAAGGTLFLDEIGELAPPLQAKLLRFLQDRQFERVGENQTRNVDVRIVTATNRDLEAEVKAGHFREDLLFRLNTFELLVPPLRERPEDILPLSRRFLDLFSQASPELPRLELLPETEAALLGYAWPGNLRELRNALERAAILATGSRIGPALLPERIASHSARPELGGNFSIEEIEREHLQRVLARSSSSDEAARILGIDASTLWRKRKRYEGGS